MTVHGRPRIRRGVVTVVGFVALAVVPVLGLNSLATANTGTAGTSGTPTTLNDEQRQCLAEQGVTLPVDGTRPALTEQQRADLHAAAKACGLPHKELRAHGSVRALTDEQRQCLTGQGISLPVRPADGTRPRISAEQRAAFRAAAAACGLRPGLRALRLATKV